jgi:hypothetical protein
MSGILPSNGVPPAQTQNGLLDPNLVAGCDNLYYGPRCNPRLDPFAMNAFISEFLNALDSIGQAYDCTRLDNLAAAFQTLQGEPVALPGGAPAAVLQHRLPSGQIVGRQGIAGAWQIRPLNFEQYDPGNIVALGAGDTFTVNVDCYAEYSGMFYQCGRCMDRLWCTTDGNVAGSGFSRYNLTSGDADLTIMSEGHAWLTAGKTYRQEAFVQRLSGTTGTLGINASTGMDEIYSEIRLWRMAAA